MRLYTIEIDAGERTEFGRTRVIEDVIRSLRHVWDNFCATHKTATIKITVTAEEPESEKP